jgi:ArsR family transcriptional regulator
MAQKATPHREREVCEPMPAWDALEQSDAEHLARIFAALADPIRLRLFSMVVAGGEVCACHLQGPLDRAQPTISHHTKALADVGLIVGEKRGRWVWWRAVPGWVTLVETAYRAAMSPST